MEHTVPRVVITATGSGCGKTTVTCAILRALCDRGLSVGAFKCGPDYIDPMFHAKITGGKSTNLDSFLFDENTLRYLLCKNADGRDINVMEGVMGFYDGMGFTERASTYEIAKITESPAVLVVDAKGAALSAIAAINGFLTMYPDNTLRAVIFNRCTAGSYLMLKSEVENRFSGRVRPLGFMPVQDGYALESRHLGLVMADEVEDLEEKLALLASQAEKTIDLDGLCGLARSAPSLSAREIEIKKYPSQVRIAVARDAAFCFYYENSLGLLEEMGAQLVPFSPIKDGELPENIHGLYLGGGYPEIYARELSENTTMLKSVYAALKRGVPCIAECGGFMYLTRDIDEHPMVGYLDGSCRDTGRLTRFGYVTLTAGRDNMLCKAGDRIRAHEFHYWDCDDPGNSFSAQKSTGKSWNCVTASDRLYAGYPHFNFYSNLQFARNFYDACLKEKECHD